MARFEKHATNGDYAWIAAQPINCRQPSEACRRLHLLKGKACLKLADNGNRPLANYTCAINELSTGLSLPTSGTDDVGERLRYQELMCQALIHARESTAAQPVDRILAAAKTLYRLSPGSVPAHYYLSRARLMEAQDMLSDHGATHRPACIRLKRTTTDVLSMIQTAERQPPPQWNRFADRYQRLAFELGDTLGSMGCR